MFLYKKISLFSDFNSKKTHLYNPNEIVPPKFPFPKVLIMF